MFSFRSTVCVIFCNMFCSMPIDYMYSTSNFQVFVLQHTLCYLLKRRAACQLVACVAHETLMFSFRTTVCVICCNMSCSMPIACMYSTCNTLVFFSQHSLLSFEVCSKQIACMTITRNIKVFVSKHSLCYLL